jgi:hypothetical protein
MTFEDFIAEMRPLHNQICVLYDSEIVRLVGVGRDESDYYYIVRTLKKAKFRDQEYWGSAVGHCVSLKGLYPEKNYDNMDHVHALNGAGPSDAFLIVDQTTEDYVPAPAAPALAPDAIVDPERMLATLCLSRFEICEVGLRYPLAEHEVPLFFGREGSLEQRFALEIGGVNHTYWPLDSDKNELVFTLDLSRTRNDTLESLATLIEEFVEARLAEEETAVEAK